MLLTVTTTHNPATDIGYLLHKNPSNLHSVELNFGTAHVFYPEAAADRCTAALLLDVDPVKLVRKGGRPGEGFALEQYVNDRPYVASSFMSVALNKVFGTLFSGNSKKPDLMAASLPLEVKIHALPCRGGKELLQRLFGPLGYEIDALPIPLDPQFPDWGDSSYYTVTLKRTCPLREFFVHLYVLIPVLDNGKHYYVGQDELEKLLKFGESWLAQHPEKEFITRRYLKNSRPLVLQALDRLLEGQERESNEEDPGDRPPQKEEKLEEKISLNQRRLEWIAATLKKHGARRIIDLGCGEGKLMRVLSDDRSFEFIAGCDVSFRSLEIAKRRLKFDRLSDLQRRRLDLFQTALTYRDRRLAGYDAATMVEVIEHLDLPRLDALKRAVFEFARPPVALVTTPNAEYNVLFEGMKPGEFRHKDHRFEWTRDEFQKWATDAAAQYGYQVSFEGIGEAHETHGSPTQAGIFTRHE